MPSPKPVITLATDFGVQDPYVGLMKGVILSINPDAEIVDVTHGITPQNVLQGSFLLHHSRRYFPKDAIHVAVVDPGVGTNRRAVLLETPARPLPGPRQRTTQPRPPARLGSAVDERRSQWRFLSAGGPTTSPTPPTGSIPPQPHLPRAGSSSPPWPPISPRACYPLSWATKSKVCTACLCRRLTGGTTSSEEGSSTWTGSATWSRISPPTS